MYDLVRQMIDIAEQEGDGPQAKERCGIIVRRGENKFELVELPNTHEKPIVVDDAGNVVQRHFSISPVALMPYVSDDTLLATWHTHIGVTATPSQADLVMIEQWHKPMHIVSWPDRGHSYTEPSGYLAPYERRVFVHGILDCYSLIRDWYKREESIELEDFDREYEWWNKDSDDDSAHLYERHFESQGFVKLPPEQESDLKVGDVLILQVESDRPNHGAIYLGDGIILHHIFGRLSEKTVYGGYWSKNTVLHLRHKSKM